MAIQGKKWRVAAQEPYVVKVFGKAVLAAGVVGVVTGKGFALARTGVGTYSVTLTGGAVNELVMCAAGLLNGGPTTQRTAQVLTFVPATGVTTLVTSAASPVNAAADFTGTLFFNLAFLLQGS